MTETVPVPQTESPLGSSTNGGGPSDQTGDASFAELVWTHYWWEQERYWDREKARPETEQAFRAKLREFENREGEIEGVYWSTRNASAVALTVKRRAPRIVKTLRENDSIVRLHRLTDWATRDIAPISELLHQCDMLAIKISEVLRGTSQRIAMQWLFALETHLLGFVERTNAEPNDAELHETVRRQERALERIEDYYHRAAGKSSRIVYFSGMLIGTLFVIALAPILVAVFYAVGLFDAGYRDEVELFFTTYAAGALGALVSVMTRMGSGQGKFALDYEVGRPLLRRLGSFRPFVGAVFGVALYFLLASGLPQVDLPEDERGFFYFGIAAFLAGFSERWTKVILGGAERTIGGALDGREDETHARDGATVPLDA